MYAVKIYCPEATNRIKYIFDVFFGNLIICNYEFISDKKEFLKADGIKINYSEDDFYSKFLIKPFGLLHSNNIELQRISIINYESYPAFFAVDDSNLPFDIFSAAFYLITRYEEYLPHFKDKFGRYSHSSSIAFNAGFLNLPLVNFWAVKLCYALNSTFGEVVLQTRTFSYQPTYDIDMAWSYKNKGFNRNAGGFMKQPGLSRILTLAGLKKDPFDSFDFLSSLKTSKIPLYFFLVSEQNGIYDKNILPSNKAFRNLIKSVTGKVLLHPSWQSNADPEIVKREKEILEDITGTNISAGRQHYIKFQLPETFCDLLNCRITEEYSMGYGTINGFRASISSPYKWYNLSTEEITDLTIHPFCFMDANSFYEQKQDLAATEKELNFYLEICKSNGCDLITIFHNNFLGSSPEFSGYRQMYSDFLSRI